MKKNGFQKDRWWSVLIKTLMIMNLSIFILCLTVFSVAASETYSQKTKLSLSIHDANIEDVLKSIEDQSEFRFFYTEKPSVENKISVDCEKKTIGEVLEGIFKGTDIAYRIVGRQIALYRNTSEPSVFQAEQQKSISGKVTDSSGGALPGVTVVVKGTTNGSITDANGRYSLANIPANATLQFSFVGMKMQEIAVGNKTTINVTLAEETVGIEEVVAIGYGVQKKSDLTGSITSVKADQIKNLPVRSISEALQGRIAGVMINKSSGRPGASSEIIIRGVGSINGLSPLFIIDGVSRGNNVNYNPKDVESIEVIKDASAAAIYGAQAAGGVVLITTKKGSFNQKTEVDVSSDFGVRQITKSYNMLETVPYIKARQAIGDNYSLWSDPASLPNTNWFKELFRTGTEQSHMISIRGGTEKVSYYVSGGYENEEGIEKKNEWERFSFRANSDFKLSKHFTLGTRIYATKIMDNPYTV